MSTLPAAFDTTAWTQSIAAHSHYAFIKPAEAYTSIESVHCLYMYINFNPFEWSQGSMTIQVMQISVTPASETFG